MNPTDLRHAVGDRILVAASGQVLEIPLDVDEWDLKSVPSSGITDQPCSLARDHRIRPSRIRPVPIASIPMSVLRRHPVNGHERP
jgi:hypothetical protein